MAMVNPCFVLNRERKGLKITVQSVLSGLDIKERLEQAETAGDILYVPGELTKEPEGYSVYIRNKTSLKEYLAEAVPDTELMVLLIESLCKLWQECEATSVPFYHVLFDYDAVFISGFMEQLEFVYLPGVLGMSKINNSFGDMLTLIQIHAENGSSDACKEAIQSVLNIITRWEAGSDAFPKAELGKWLLGMKPEPMIQRLLRQTKAVWTRFFCIRWCVLLSDAPLPIQEEITVGRDKLWADYPIDDAFVSRRHAVLFQQRRSVTVRDLFSSNGTYVDGQRIAAGEEVVVHSGQVIRFGERSQFSVKFRPRILFTTMLK